MEPATVRSVCPKWKDAAKQNKILESIFLSGLRHPSVQDINRITVELQCHGPVESKNVAYWFQKKFDAKEKRMNGRPETGNQLDRLLPLCSLVFFFLNNLERILQIRLEMLFYKLGVKKEFRFYLFAFPISFVGFTLTVHCIFLYYQFPLSTYYRFFIQRFISYYKG